MSDELLKRLDARTKLRPHGFFSVTVQDEDCAEAAARIRELEAERLSLINDWKNACELMNRAEAERDGWKEGARLGHENTREQRERAERAEKNIVTILDEFTAALAKVAAERDAYRDAATARDRNEDALRRDAERYRWLKVNARRIDFAGLCWSQGCELDARIDAAIDQAKKETK